MISRASVLALPFALVMTAAVWSAPSSADSAPVRVWGTVANMDGAPVADATVSIYNPPQGLDRPVATTRTDSGGRFEFSDRDRELMPHGPHGPTLTAQARGLACVAHEIDWSPEESSFEVKFELPEATSLSGCALTSTGEPAAGARVLLYGSTVQVLECDAEGGFHSDAMAPGCFLKISASPGDSPFEWVGEFGLSDDKIEIPLSPRVGVVTGTVVDGLSEEPISGELVWLGDDVSGYDAWCTRTDAEGRYRFETIPLEHWNLTLPESGMAPNLRRLRLTDERPEQDTLVHRGTVISVAGVVVDHGTGEPVPDFPILFGGRNQDFSERHSSRTDAEGRFQIDGVRVSRILVIGRRRTAPPERQPFFLFPQLDAPNWFIHGGGVSYLLTAVPDLAAAQELLIEVVDAGPVEIVTLDPDGGPLENASLTFWTDQGSSGGEIGATGEDGHIDAPWDPWGHRWRVSGSHPDFPLLISSGRGREDRCAEVRPVLSGPLAVHVVDQAGGPVEGATVQVILRLAHDVGYWRLPSEFESRTPEPAETDTEGHARFDSVLRCRQEIRASAPEIGEATEFVDLAQVPSGTPVTLQLAEPDKDIRQFRVLDIAGEPIEGASVAGEVTDAQGLCELPMLPPVAPSWQGPRIRAEGFSDAPIPQLDEEIEGEIAITLLPEITIRGRVHRADGSLATDGVLILWAPEQLTHRWMYIAADGLSQPTRAQLWGGRGFQSQYPGVSGFFGEKPNQAPLTPTTTVVSPAPPTGFDWRPRPESRDLDGCDLTSPLTLMLMAVTPSGEVAAAEFTIDATPGQVIDVGSLTLQPPIALRGRVVDPQGEPVRWARLEWTDWLTPAVSRIRARGGSAQQVQSEWFAIADAAGHFALSGLPPGRSRVVVTADGRRTQSIEFLLPAEEEITLVFDPPEGEIAPGTVLVRVLDREHRPVAGAIIGLYGRGYTDLRGEARVDVPSDGWIAAEWRGQLSRTAVRLPVEISPGEGREVVIDASTWPTLAVEASPGHAVLVEEIEGEAEAAALVNAEGVASFALPAGTYRLRSGDVSREIVLAPDDHVRIVLAD